MLTWSRVLLTQRPAHLLAPHGKVLELYSLQWSAVRPDGLAEGSLSRSFDEWFLYPYHRTSPGPVYTVDDVIQLQDKATDAIATFTATSVKGFVDPNRLTAGFVTQGVIPLFKHRCKRLTMMDNAERRGDINIADGVPSAFCFIWYKEVKATRGQLIYEWLKRK